MGEVGASIDVAVSTTPGSSSNGLPELDIRGRKRETLVDPAISQAKMMREIQEYRAISAEGRKKGWFLVDAEFPEVFFVFAAPHLRPPTLAFGVVIDFTNYDLWPPSVTLVNPFTRAPYRTKELHPAFLMKRRIPAAAPIMIPNVGPVVGYTEQDLMQQYGPDDIPFFCIPGVREYHHHPAHSGDSWLSHRGNGEGKLFFILDQLHRYGIQPLKGYELAIQISGYARPESPE